jgi:hypothetical protein
VFYIAQHQAKARDVKPILAIICTVLIGSSAFAADLELKCRGDLFEGPRPAHPIAIEFAVSVSGSEVTLQADPKYSLGGPPFVLKRSNAAMVHFESVERSKSPGREEKPRASGTFFRTAGRIFIGLDDEARRLVGDCELLVGSRSASTIS